MSSLQNIDSADQIGVILIAAIHSATAEGKAGLEKAVLEKCVVVAIVLCLFMRQCADQHH